MSEAPDNVHEKLSFFGISKDESLLYTHLLKHGSKSALSLSRELKIARTKIYRLIEKLSEKGFIIEEVKAYGSRFAAQSYEKFNLFIEEKQSELNTIKSVAPEMFNQLAQIQSQLDEESKILHYRGVEGLKQVTWNSLKAKDVLRIYEIKDMSGFLDDNFAEKVREELVKRKITTHQLTNLKQLNEYTTNKEFAQFWVPKYIDSDLLNIDFEILIYNNVYCMYSYKDNDIFIIEIYNQKLADMQTKIFDFVWNYARPMKIVSPNGAAILPKGNNDNS